jgi:hypothetical protein
MSSRTQPLRADLQPIVGHMFEQLALARISHKHSAASPQVLGSLRQTAHFDPQSIYNAIPVEMLALFPENRACQPNTCDLSRRSL